MKLVSLLSERRVVPDMKSETHWDALSELVDHLIASGHIAPERREGVLESLHQREEQVSTGIGHGVAIPHAYCDQIEQPVAVFGRSRDGIEFEACDNAPVHFVVLMLVPQDQPHLHLQTLASIARLFSQGEVRKKMKEAEGPDGIMRALGGVKPKRLECGEDDDVMTLAELLRERLRAGFVACGVEGELLEKIGVIQAADLRFGDYQSNAAMVLAKTVKQNPRALAEAAMAATEVDDLAEVEIAGPGFLNFRIKAGAFAARLGSMLADGRLGVAKAEDLFRIVIDFSAPNVAKPMHVGHIRSTIIGDALGRVARFLGHEVITDNHIGDWGTQFGMVIWAWKRELNREALESGPLHELLRLYRVANSQCKEDEAIREECRQELVALQQGDPGNLEIWEECVRLSRNGLQVIYDRLNVHFDHWLGESCYNDRLEGVVDSLVEAGQARESEGAICVFSDGTSEPGEDPFKIRKGEDWTDKPMIIRKSDGGFNYATTDIATIDYRLDEFDVDWIWYVVDHRQGDHFKQLFSVARRRGHKVAMSHISFGTILGKDGTPLKTRAGDLPQLDDVLDDAVKAARASAEGRTRVESEEERAELAEMIGISAIKFMELFHHRTSDYVFDIEKMVAMEGDTAPYLQYSYVRCCGIFRKLEEEVVLDGEGLELTDEKEIHLARMLARFGETVPVVLDDFRPNLLASYLLDLARAYHSFFQSCPVLIEEGAVRKTRLVLCELTARVLQKGLELLGIEVPERM